MVPDQQPRELEVSRRCPGLVLESLLVVVVVVVIVVVVVVVVVAVVHIVAVVVSSVGCAVVVVCGGISIVSVPFLSLVVVLVFVGLS